MSGELEKLILGDIDVEINPSESTEERDVYCIGKISFADAIKNLHHRIVILAVLES